MIKYDYENIFLQYNLKINNNYKYSKMKEYSFSLYIIEKIIIIIMKGFSVWGFHSLTQSIEEFNSYINNSFLILLICLLFNLKYYFTIIYCLIILILTLNCQNTILPIDSL